jgi:hypothetical protein
MPLPDQIKPGDVLLTRGTESISRAICLMDDSEVSHAALALGDDTLAEVVGEGLRTITFARAMEGHDLAVGRTLTAPADTTPVLDVARGYLSRHTAYAHQRTSRSCCWPSCASPAASPCLRAAAVWCGPSWTRPQPR